ncbi:MAG: response regulator, partial [[Bacteroides] pectinophilus]|nr:response regulator [[Bacteroides] pectinophilus]
MRIAVCDDEENALRQVRSVINKLSVVDEAEYYSDMDAFMERINTGIYYDIVMMDIDWNSGRTGIDCASQLYRLAPETKLIFFTGYSQRYIEAVFMKRTNIEGYLAKPVKQQALERLILKAVSDVRTSGEASMTIKQKGGTVTLPLAHIRYIESR